jgi:LGFP repeat
MGIQEGLRTIVIVGKPIVVHPVLVDRELTAIASNIRERAAEATITGKWNRLGGAPGPSRSAPGPEGLVAVNGGFYRDYANGAIYTKPGVGTFWVHGDIGNHYRELGGPESWLGWPTSDEEPFDGGRVSNFQNGAIYWWQDTGPIALGDVKVRYRGLVCFGETDWDQGDVPPEDEPYVLLPAVPAIDPSARSQVYKGVDAGESRGDLIDLYEGRPYGVAVVPVLMEHDFGDPNAYLADVQKGVDVVMDGIEYVVKLIPYGGPAIASAIKPYLDDAAPGIAKAINDLFDFGDDVVGVVSVVISPKQLVVHAVGPSTNFKGIDYKIESPLISGQGASYKVYFDVVQA